MGAGNLIVTRLIHVSLFFGFFWPFQKLTSFSTDVMNADWELRFMNGTTIHGAGTPPEIWMKQPVQEKEETKDIKKTHEGNLIGEIEETKDIKRTKEGNAIEEKEETADSPDFPDDEKTHNGERQFYTTRFGKK